MTGPDAVLPFLRGMALGCLPGLWQSALEPLRQRRPALGDALLLPAMAWAWLEMMFGICRGDLRLWALASLGLGWLLWSRTAGRAAGPLFRRLWAAGAGCFGFFWQVCKKILKIIKILFASSGKSVTI